MTPSIFIRTFESLRELGYVSSASDFSRLLGRNPQWVTGLKRTDGQAPEQIRQDSVMRLRRRILFWQATAPRPAAKALGDLINRLDEFDTIMRWLAR